MNVNQVALSALVASLPSSREQHEIVRREQTLDGRLRAERGKINQLRRIRAGLMDDLLTGRVRVTPLLANNEREAS